VAIYIPEEILFSLHVSMDLLQVQTAPDDCATATQMALYLFWINWIES